MAAAARTIFRSPALTSGIFKTINGATKLPNSTRLVKLVQGNGLSQAIKARGLSQLGPCLALQISRNISGSLNSTLIDKCFISKPSALTLAVNETEVTSVEETDEDEEATLYILSEMFSMITICPGDG